MADTLLENAVYVPDGRLIGTGLIASTVTGAHGMYIAPTLAADAYTLSVFAAPEDKDWIVIYNDTVGPTGQCGCYFDVANGVKGTEGSSIFAAGIEGPYKGGYTGGTDLDFYRCWIGFTGTAAAHTLCLLAADADGDNTFAGTTGVVSAYFWGAQCELGYRPTSPIITDGAAASRVADELAYNSGATIADFDKGTISCKVVSDMAAVEEGTIVTLDGDSTRLSFHTDNEEHISMKMVPLPT